MDLYLYESHHEGLYLSLRDDLDTEVCGICGDSDRMLEEYYIDEYDDWGEDISDTIEDLLFKVIKNNYSGTMFNELIDNLIRIVGDLYLTDKTIDKDDLIEIINDAREEALQRVKWFIDTIDREVY